MKKKELKEIMEQIHKMDNIQLLNTIVGCVRMEAVARYTKASYWESIAEDLALYMGSMVTRLDLLRGTKTIGVSKLDNGNNPNVTDK